MALLDFAKLTSLQTRSPPEHVLLGFWLLTTSYTQLARCHARPKAPLLASQYHIQSS